MRVLYCDSCHRKTVHYIKSKEHFETSICDNCGKEEIIGASVEMNEEIFIPGWVARNNNGRLWVHTGMAPIYKKHGIWMGSHESFSIDRELHPEITWESEPVEVEITIKLKN